MCKKKKENGIKTPEIRKRSRKPTSKFHKFIHYGLKQKLRCWILSPLIIGIALTVAISFSIVLYVEPNWFALTGSEIVKNQLNSMQSISGSVSDFMREYIQRIVNDGLFINDYTKKVLTKDPYFYYENKTSTAIPYLLTTTAESNAKIQSHPLKNMGYFSWYLDRNTNNSSQITDPQTKENLIIANNLEIVVRPVYRNADRLQRYESKSNYVLINHIFDYDGLFYFLPCPSANLTLDFSSLETNQTCLQEKKMDINMVCTEYFIEAKERAESKKKLITLSAPYPLNNSANATFRADSTLALRSCQAILNETTSKLRVLTCITANISDLAQHIDNSSATKLGEFTVLQYDSNGFGTVVYRGSSSMNLTTFFANKNRSNLADWEFGSQVSSSNSELLALKAIFLKANQENNGTYVDLYERNGRTFLIALTNVRVFMGYADGDEEALFTTMFTISKDVLLSEFENVKNTISQRLLTQLLIIGAVILVILIIALQTINYIANSIVSPMDDLVMKVRKMQEGDDEVEIIENFTEKSYEINCLYITFSKLANVLKYANKAFFEGNDAEALIRYAQALRLFSDLNNRKAMASIYNNIGNIHLLGERYEEAIENYKLSVQITEEEFKKATKLNKAKSLKDTKGSKGTYKSANERESRKSGASSATRYSNLHYSLKNESKKSNGSSYRDSSKRSTLGPQSLAETKAILETQIANRQFQLANALIGQTEKTKVNNWEEITRRLNKVLQIDIEQKKCQSRIVKTHLLISNAFLEMGEFKKSQQHIVSAEEKLREYTNMFSQGMLSEREIPPDILWQKVFLQKGMILKKIGRTRTAAEKFTDCLEIGTVYDPEIRRKCLEQLKEILESKGLLEQAPNIPKILDNTVSKKNKDIVFALDYSESMTQPGRLEYAIKAIVTIYDDYIKDNDRVGFIRFNKNVDVIFGLSERGKNRVYLRKCLQSKEEVIKPHGETAFFTAIKESLKLHKKAERKDHSRWIVALTDGEDNASRIKYEEIYKKLKGSDINLIIVGLALDEKIIPLLRELCLATPEGVFIETPENNDLEIAFQSITDIIYGTSDIIIESWN